MAIVKNSRATRQNFIMIMAEFTHRKYKKNRKDKPRANRFLNLNSLHPTNQGLSIRSFKESESTLIFTIKMDKITKKNKIA